MSYPTHNVRICLHGGECVRENMESKRAREVRGKCEGCWWMALPGNPRQTSIGKECRPRCLVSPGWFSKRSLCFAHSWPLFIRNAESVLSRCHLWVINAFRVD
ncbi:hypothetical protein CDAR_560971 [Caerostris darwini]|uniref:Uncharacterized protein n=1 Tax=Caerostris darwini TaxID=1538125 RepID=A0AAV4TDN0_9ARAC|nr:hypothetical protein CDAR_560971 [Caerostris darwini]